MTKKLPSQSDLKSRFDYDPETGKLYWKRQGKSKAWDTRWAEKEAFSAVANTGYKTGVVFGSHWLAHRIIFKMVSGYDPDHIDHINGDRADNRWENIRDAGVLENRRNTARSKRNKSGQTGVRWNADRQKWTARIQNKHIGCFQSKSDAIAARKAAERKHGFHPNHGRA